MRVNKVKERLLEGKPVLGAELGLGSPLVAEIFSRAGFDFVQVDNQHGSWDYTTTMFAFRSIGLGSAVPITRVRQNDFYAIGGLLDRGALGIVVPMVETVKQAEAAVRAVRYPPKGSRSWGPFAADIYDFDYEKEANEEIYLAIQIESAQAAKDVEQIMAVDGIDGCWIGPYDLAKTMDVEVGSREHEAAILRVRDACRKTNKIPGIYGGGGTAQHRLEQGFLYVTVGGDEEFLTTRARQVLDNLQQWR